jgi:hypothetical protein
MYAYLIMNNWTEDIEQILENIRINSVLLSNHHKDRFYHYKGHLKYFKLPLIVLSSITSIASVGLSSYMKQADVSLLTCLLSLTSAILASIELYLGIQKNMEQELLASRKFLLLSYSIYKVKYIEKPNRVENPRAFLEEIYNEYTKLVENSNLIKNAKLKDALAPIPDSFKSALVPTPTSTKQPTNFGVELHQLADMPIV